MILNNDSQEEDYLGGNMVNDNMREDRQGGHVSIQYLKKIGVKVEELGDDGEEIKHYPDEDAYKLT